MDQRTKISGDNHVIFIYNIIIFTLYLVHIVFPCDIFNFLSHDNHVIFFRMEFAEKDEQTIDDIRKEVKRLVYIETYKHIHVHVDFTGDIHI